MDFSDFNLQKKGCVIPVLKINNLTENGDLDLSNIVYISEEYASSFIRYQLAPGDLVTAAQATTGRSALASDDVAGAVISQHLIKVTVDKRVCLPEYLLLCFISPLIIGQMNAVKQKSTRDGLNTEDVANFKIPVPSIAEQERIVSNINSINTSIEAVLENIEKKKVLGKRLINYLLNGELI